MKCHCDKKPDPSGYVASLCDHGHTNPTGGPEAHSLQTAKHQSIQSTYTQTQLFTGIHSYCSYVRMYVYAQGYSCNITRYTYKSYNRIRQDTYVMHAETQLENKTLSQLP